MVEYDFKVVAELETSEDEYFGIALETLNSEDDEFGVVVDVDDSLVVFGTDDPEVDDLEIVVKVVDLVDKEFEVVAGAGGMEVE